MSEVRWDCYPTVAASPRARTWLQLQAHLRLAPKTLDAYGRSLEDYLRFAIDQDMTPETATREDLARYVNDLSTRTSARAGDHHRTEPPCGLANATIQLRLTTVRLFYDYLIEATLRETNPVGRGRYTPGKAFAGQRDRGLVQRLHRLPWIPSDDQWRAILAALGEEPPRNRLMLLVAYEGALRREEVVTLTLGDLDVAFRQVTIRSEVAKNGAGRVVFYGETTSRLLATYLRQRRTLSAATGPLFLSESRRNRGQGVSPSLWSKIVEQIARRADVPQFTTHTLRHLRLTHMARAGLDLHQIALYAGHRNTQTTLQYIHLSGVELATALTRSMVGFERWLQSTAATAETPP